MHDKSNLALILTSMILLLAGCSKPVDSVIAPATVEAALVPVQTAAPIPSLTIPPEPSQEGKASPLIQITPGVTPTINEDPFAGLRIDDLTARSYGGPGIAIGDIVKIGDGFTRYQMVYYS